MTRLLHHYILAAGVLLVSGGSAVAGPNLISTSNFASGPARFSSDYDVPSNPACIYDQAMHCRSPAPAIIVNTDPSLDHPAWASFGASAGSALDDVALVALTVPEPASAAALIVGMAVIMVIRNRRRRGRR